MKKASIKCDSMRIKSIHEKFQRIVPILFLNRLRQENTGIKWNTSFPPNRFNYYVDGTGLCNIMRKSTIRQAGEPLHISVHKSVVTVVDDWLANISKFANISLLA